MATKKSANVIHGQDQVRGPRGRAGAAEVLRQREAVELARLAGGAEERAVAARRSDAPAVAGELLQQQRDDEWMRADPDQRDREDRPVGRRPWLRGGDRAEGIEISRASSAPPITSAPVTRAARTTAGPTGVPTREPSGVEVRALVGDPEIAVDEPPEVVAVLLVEGVMEVERRLRLRDLVGRRLLHVHEEARRVRRDRLVERERQERE